MTEPFDVLIIGGGIVGLSAALGMASHDLKVAVIDSGTLSVKRGIPDTRVYAINHASKTLLDQLGVWSLMDPSRIVPYPHMHVWDASNSACIEFDARVIARPELGHIIEESLIKDALLKKLDEIGTIKKFPSETVIGVDYGQELVAVRSEKLRWQAKLLLVADGKESFTRALLNVPLTTWPYHQNALVATVNTEKKHQHTAYQVFNADGPLAFLPLADNYQCSIVWSTTPARAAELLTLPEEFFNEKLGQAFAHKLGKVKLQSSRHQFPLIMQHAKQYAGKNWALLGDAAHTIHPLAGLGLNVGLADVVALLSCLEHSPTALFSQRELNTYQRQRKYEVWKIIALMSGLKNVFANPLTPVAAIRGIGLEICNRWTPLKRLFIEHAAG